MTQVFISYSRRDLAFVEQLAADLQAAGLDVWYDLSNLAGGSRWSREIEKAIRDSQYVLVILSPESVASKWVEEEFLYASELGKKIIPLFFKKCALPFGYRTLHFIDIQGSKYKQKFSEILRALDVKPVVKKEPLPPEDSFPPGWDETWQPSFDRTKSVSKNSEDKQRQSIKPESKSKKSEEKQFEVPKSELKKLRISRKVRNQIIIVIVGTIVISILGLPLIENWFTATPEQIPTATFFALPKTVTPVIAPSQTLVRTLTSTNTVTLTATFVMPTRSRTPIPVATTTPMVFNPHPDFSDFIDTFGVSMRLVPAGEFVMGSAYGESDEKPAHEVYINSYYIDKYEVTISLYKMCVYAGKCELLNYFHYNHSDQDEYYAQFPISNVDWDIAKAFCEWRDARLPTEAEWEKAARGTDERPYPWGIGIGIDCTRANYGFCSPWPLSDAPRQVGGYLSGKSPYDVYDMAGNITEWVADWYSETYYNQSPKSNPAGPVTGKYRVIRGGSFTNQNGSELRSSRRNYSIPPANGDALGFRCAKDATP